MTTAAGRKLSGVLVSGVIAEDTNVVGAALQALGIRGLESDDALHELGSRVLAAAGGTWEEPPPAAASELAHIDGPLAEEARHDLRDTLEERQQPTDELWVWADPRHSLLAPFWSSALDIGLAIVHVHRDPLSSVAALVREHGVEPETALMLWERYNRAALVSCGQWPSLVLSHEAMAADPETGAQALASFLNGLGAFESHDLASASKAISAALDTPVASSGHDVVLSPAHQVLDEILRDLDGHVMDGVAGDSGATSAFAHLTELYSADYYHEYDGGVPYSRAEPQWIRFFGEVADNIVAKIGPRTMLDAGCAIGLLVEALRDRGVAAYGIDISEWAIDQVPDAIRPYCRAGSIADGIEGHYDLITCIEVLEHLPVSQADPVIENLCAHADAVLFSSTPDEFDDPTHLNVETTGYWAKLFASHGFIRDFDHDASYLAPQAILFRKGAHDALNLVTEYERMLWRMREAFAGFTQELQEEWRKTAIHAEELQGLFEEATVRIDELEHLYDFDVADERTVAALERLMVEPSGLHTSVVGPPVTGTPDDFGPSAADDYSRWRAARVTASAPGDGPLFSVVVPVFDPVAEHLVACIRSVRAQSYPNWELVLVDVSGAPHVRPICERFAALDGRVRIVRHPNAGIAENTDAGVKASGGEWVAFLDHDDTLEPHALAALARYIEGHDDADLVYSDEDKLDPEGCYVAPFFKPDWSPDLLRNVNYVCHLVGVRRTLYEHVGGLRAGYEGAQDYDFVLRATAEARHVGHVADVLYHWRQHPGSTASDVRVKPDAHSAGRRALEHFARDNIAGAWLEPGADLSTHRVRYPLRYEKVSIIIPFRDQPELTDACVRSLFGSTPVLPIEVLLVSNQSREDGTFAMMQEWERQFEWARVLEFDEPFNFQKLNNWAARQAQGELLLFLNNDVEALHAGWLEALAEHAQRPEVGAVGARLFYPDGLVQHAGVAVGIGGLADHPWAGMHPDAWTPTGPSYWTRDILAVTAACLMVEHEKFDGVNGFDERFIVCGGDVDLCLRLYERSLWNVMTPFARLLHRESATRQKDPPANDVQESLRAYAPYLGGGDPFFNPNLTRADRSCRVAVPTAQTPEK